MHRFSAVRSAVILSVVVLSTAISCNTDSAVDRTVSPSTEGQSGARLSQDAAEKVSLSKQRLAFVGAVHSEMIRDLNANKALWLLGRGTGTVRQRRCAALAEVVLTYGARLDQQAAITRSDVDARNLTAAILQRQALCRGVGTMSVFGSPLVVSPAASIGSMEDEVTGEFEPYVNTISSAYGGTDGSPSQVEAMTSSVVSSASSIPQPDLDVVVAAAGVAVSSAYEWSAVQSSGGFDGAEYPPPPMTSLFMKKAAVLPILAYIGGADALGCGVGALASLAGGERRALQIAGQCGWWAVGGSAAAYLGLFAT